MGAAERQRLQFQLRVGSPVERRRIPEHLPLHHAEMRAAEREVQLRFLEPLIPLMLQHGRQARIRLQEVGELVDEQSERRLFGEPCDLLPSLFP